MSDNRMLKLSLDEALELNLVGIFQYRLLIICGFAFMADALEVNLLVFLSTCAGEEWMLSNEQKASIGGVVFGGILVGNLFWGVFADRYGRKLTFILACSFISVNGFLSGVATSYYWLIFFRAMCGFGIGGSSIPFDLLAELLPSSHRGLFLIYIDYFWTIGALMVTAIAWIFLESSGWRTLAFLTAIPVTITLLFSICYLPESPRWLLMKGRTAEAEKIVRDAVLVNNGTMPPFALSCEERNEEQHNVNDASYSDLLRTKELRDITIPLWVVWFAFGFTYYGLILFVGRLNTEVSTSTSSSSAGGEVKQCSFDYKAMMINSCAEFVGIAVVSCVIDRVGRINTQKIFYLLSGVTVFLMGLGLQADPLLVVSLVGRLAVMAASIVTWVSTPELFSTHTRTVGHASCVAWSRVGALLSPYVVTSSLSVFQLGVVLGVANLMAVGAAHCLPETAGRCLEDFHQPIPHTAANSNTNTSGSSGSNSSKHTVTLVNNLDGSFLDHYSSDEEEYEGVQVEMHTRGSVTAVSGMHSKRRDYMAVKTSSPSVQGNKRQTEV